MIRPITRQNLPFHILNYPFDLRQIIVSSLTPSLIIRKTPLYRSHTIFTISFLSIIKNNICIILYDKKIYICTINRNNYPKKNLRLRFIKLASNQNRNIMILFYFSVVISVIALISFAFTNQSTEEQ